VDDNGVIVVAVVAVVAALEEEVDILYTEEWVVENDTTRMSALNQKEKRQRKSYYLKKDKWHQIITDTKSPHLQQ
jgi:predicted DNA-binding protein (MmcQ/YjbR family)